MIEFIIIFDYKSNLESKDSFMVTEQKNAIQGLFLVITQVTIYKGDLVQNTAENKWRNS